MSQSFIQTLAEKAVVKALIGTIYLLLNSVTFAFAADLSTDVISLKYPNSWKVSPGDAGCSNLSSPSKPSHDEFSVEVCSFQKDLEQAAYDSGIFDKNTEGMWVTIASQGNSQIAKRIADATWGGIQAVINCGIEDEAGFHAVGGDCFWAVISDGRHSLVIDTVGTYRDFRTLDQVVNSIRFK